MSQNSNNKMYLTLGVVAIVAIALVYVFMGNSSTPASAVTKANAAAQPAADQQAPAFPDAPDFTLKNLDNQDVNLSDYKGKVVFINFWATWCGPCRMEIPYFIELIDKYGKDGFVVLGIALDPREFNKVPGFVDQMGINYPILLDKTGVSQMYGGIRSIPTTFVVNREGKVVQRIVGSRPKTVFEQIITSNL